MEHQSHWLSFTLTQAYHPVFLGPSGVPHLALTSLNLCVISRFCHFTENCHLCPFCFLSGFQFSIHDRTFLLILWGYIFPFRASWAGLYHKPLENLNALSPVAHLIYSWVHILTWHKSALHHSSQGDCAILYSCRFSSWESSPLFLIRMCCRGIIYYN